MSNISTASNVSNASNSNANFNANADNIDNEMYFQNQISYSSSKFSNKKSIDPSSEFNYQHPSDELHINEESSIIDFPHDVDGINDTHNAFQNSIYDISHNVSNIDNSHEINQNTYVESLNNDKEHVVKQNKFDPEDVSIDIFKNVFCQDIILNDKRLVDEFDAFNNFDSENFIDEINEIKHVLDNCLLSFPINTPNHHNTSTKGLFLSPSYYYNLPNDVLLFIFYHYQVKI